MLQGLHITNMLLIDQLDLDFKSGLNVLTGETGAGKSILLDSLGFVLGWRGRADLVRKGAEQGSVTAYFQLLNDHPALAVLSEAGLSVDDNELVLRRTNTPDGRKTSYINDQRCSGELLRKLSETLVELHGQHDDRGLLNPRGHLDVLDAFAGIDLAPIRVKWRAVATAQKDLNAAREVIAEAEKDAEYLRHSVAEFDELSPTVGEDAALDTKRRQMQSAERIREDIVKANTALGIDGGEGPLIDGLRWLEGAANDAEGRLNAPIEALNRAMSELADAQQGVQNCLAALDFNPLELEQVEERLFAIRDLGRKHNIQPDDLPDFADGLRKRLLVVDTGSEHLAALQDTLSKAQSAYDDLANKIATKRSIAAKRLDKAMAAELAPLKMEAARFETIVTTVPASNSGINAVEFQVATNPGAPAGAINKIASGGELSRFLLALKVCLTEGVAGLTLIFDEIDRGVGGATADAVGRRLKSLADKGQVLVVTHSPQVAALGAHQWQVSKSVTKGITTSRVDQLDETARIDEIARMLAGDTITDEARAAANALLRG